MIRDDGVSYEELLRCQGLHPLVGKSVFLVAQRYLLETYNCFCVNRSRSWVAEGEVFRKGTVLLGPIILPLSTSTFKLTLAQVLDFICTTHCWEFGNDEILLPSAFSIQSLCD